MGEYIQSETLLGFYALNRKSNNRNAYLCNRANVPVGGVYPGIDLCFPGIGR